ncbi:hypothetical protein ACFZAG_39885 [Streptomyces sp. NPDC012403]|uniref:hypothetical protein n=1 Tax=Streptomyces sp. NPDC012403 TaxID=3364831 RepID=UPI0036E423BA
MPPCQSRPAATAAPQTARAMPAQTVRDSRAPHAVAMTACHTGWVDTRVVAMATDVRRVLG